MMPRTSGQLLRLGLVLLVAALPGRGLGKGRPVRSLGVSGRDVEPSAELEQALRDRVRDAGLSRGAVYIAELGETEPWLAWDADVPVRAGAAARLLVAAAALKTWGAAETLDIAFEVAPTTRIVGGAVQGNLFLRTEGDPTLTSPRLDDLVWRLRVAGVVAVTGDVVLDGTLHDDPPMLPGVPSAMSVPWAPWDQTVSPWLLEGGRYGVSAMPGVAPGHPVQVVATVPAGGWLRVNNEAATLSPSGQSRLLWERADDERGVVLNVRGGLAVGEAAWHTSWPVTDPGPFAAAAVADAFGRQGITVSGTVRIGEAPPPDARVVVTVPSAPMLSLLATMQREGSDVMAESLLRTLGAKHEGQGTTVAGLNAVRSLLSDCLTSDDVLDAGSALSRSNRIAVRSLGCVIRQQAESVARGHEWASMLGHPARGDAWVDVLGVAGWTLRGRGEEVDGVGSFAGLAQAVDGRRYVVVWLSEEPR
jgi:PBP4 family serine-type D-alanyl-D-alanine carboxypeptidase